MQRSPYSNFQEGSEFTLKDKGKLIGLLSKDALTDYSDDTPSFVELVKADQKLLTQKLNEYASRVVCENLHAIVAGEF